jgi:hypothetical protein
VGAADAARRLAARRRGVTAPLGPGRGPSPERRGAAGKGDGRSAWRRVWACRALGAALALAFGGSLPAADPRAPHLALEIALALGYGHLLGAALGARRAPLRRAAPRGWERVAGTPVAFRGCLLLGLFAAWTGLAALPAAFRVAVAVSVWHVLENDRMLARLARPGPPVPPTLSGSGVAAAGALGLVAVLPALPLFAVATLYHVGAWLGLATARAAAGPPAARWADLAGGSPPRGSAWRRLVAVHAVPAAALWVLHGLGPAAEPLRRAVFSPSLYAFAAGVHVVQTTARRVGAGRGVGLRFDQGEASHGLG